MTSSSSPSSLSVISSSGPSKEVEIWQVLKDSIIISFGIPSQAFLTHTQTSDNLARRRFPAAVTPAPPPAIQICHSLRRLSLNDLLIVTSSGWHTLVCHSLRRLSLNDLLIVTSSGWHTLVKPPGMTAKSIPLSRNLVLTDSLRCPLKESYTIIVEISLILKLDRK